MDMNVRRPKRPARTAEDSCSCGSTHPCSGTPGSRPAARRMRISIHPTTGGQFELDVPCHETVEELKRRISKQLKVAKDRIMLLHRDKQLKRGSLDENAVSEGSRITLLPAVESGLISQRPEQTVMQALDSLSETQVNDFLSGRSPLTLALRVGDHMMFVQLQLAAHQIPASHQPANQGAAYKRFATTNSKSSSFSSAAATAKSTTTATPLSSRHHPSKSFTSSASSSSSSSSSSTTSSTSTSSSSSSASQQKSSSSSKQGAFIESIKNHGPGIYSGTFSGTLSPSLQDDQGRPRRDINTILHILNDLLGATQRFSFGPGGTLSSDPPAPETTTTTRPRTPTPPPPPRSPAEVSAARMDEENRATRGKVEQLQLLMQQTRLRRKARREQRTPYWTSGRKSSRTDSTGSSSSDSGASVDMDIESSVAASDSNGYPKINPEYVFA
ncbi:hypothetical protein Bbelb_125660 [Branchiostoma belcheri]|nr:hypothetical protein Bbelb_125660 [Branchiostoma belcheri]